MSLTIEDWKAVDAAEPTDVAEALYSAANKGDWASIVQAKNANMFVPEVEHSLRTLRYVAALSILDSAALAPAQRETIGATLQEWLKDVEPGVKNFMLFRAIDPPRYFPNACKALLQAGADPYDPGPANRPSDTCLNLIFILRDQARALELMNLLFGGEPLSHPDQLPARFVSGTGAWAENLNLLEMCGQVHRFDLVDSILARIVPGTEGENIRTDLGDKVLDRLWMNSDGSDRPGKMMRLPVVGSVDVARAITYLSAGAKLRSPELLQKIAHRTIATTDGKEARFIDAIASDLTRQDFKNSAAAVSRREKMPRILDTFLEHGAVQVDEFILDGKTMLMHAAVQDEPTWVQYLLEKGADPMVTTAPRGRKKARKAAELAASAGSHECAQMIDAFLAKEAISRVLTKARETAPER
jgi:hypothetical protein